MGGGLVLLGRSYCHLCEDMLKAIEAGFPAQRVRVIDVDSDIELESAYGDLVPVLLLDGIEVCHYHLDRDALSIRLGGRSAESPATPAQC